MRNFLVRRLIQSALLLLVLMSFTFALTRLTPGGPEAALAESPNIEAADLERIRERFGLDDPIHVAYAKWIVNAAKMDFGRSYHYLRPPFEVIGERIWPTVQLALVAYVIGSLGILLGVIAAYHRGRMPDLVIRIFTVVGDATPNWWMALVIIIVLASVFGWFPQGQGRGDALTWFKHIIVPATILGLGGVIAYTRFVRSQVLEVLSLDHVRTARAKGLVENLVARRHVLRNALIPVLTLLGLSLPALFSGAVFIEAIFAWPGVGRVLVEGVVARDYPVVMAATAVSAVLVVLGNLLAEALVSWADPRVRDGGGSAMPGAGT